MASPSHRRRSQNEHAFDSVEFMALTAPHRWVVVRDFLVDLNGTKNFKMDVDDSAPVCHGSCGLRPDEALMHKEGRDPFDEKADQMNWTLKQRQTELWLETLRHKVSRIQWLDDQVHESLITGTAPMAMMTQAEQKRFLELMAAAKRRRTYEQNRERYTW